MSIFPLPVFEADADAHHRDSLTDEELYARLEPPKTIVVRFGAMKLVGEYPYDGDAKPGCGSKLVARTHRGTEIAEMLTTTCTNAGCGKSVTRQEMLDYIENSGGKDYPFYTNGRILRVATIEDLNKQSHLNTRKNDYVKHCKSQINELGLPMKLVEVEPIFGEELLTFYYMAEDRVDFRELVRRLASEFKTRIEMRQVGARDEARLVADYEKCGQHCCCKNFLKVLKPVSMRSAKVQKATLDPLKISGRCGRLMCCLRYEDQTYRELKAKLPHRNKRVGTEEGPGIVVDTKILVQLVLVRLEHDGRELAVPVEELIDPDACPGPGEAAAARQRMAEAADPLRGLSAEEVAERADESKRGRKRGRRRSKSDQQAAYRRKSAGEEARKDLQQEDAEKTGKGGEGTSDGPGVSKKKGRRRRQRRQSSAQESSRGQKGRKRRRRRKRGGGHGGNQPDSG